MLIADGKTRAQDCKVNTNRFEGFFSTEVASDLSWCFLNRELRKPRADLKLLVIEKNGHVREEMAAVSPPLRVLVPESHRFAACFELREIAGDVVIKGLQPAPGVPNAAIVAVREKRVVGRQVVPAVDCFRLIRKKPRFDLGKKFVFLFIEAIPA